MRCTIGWRQDIEAGPKAVCHVDHKHVTPRGDQPHPSTRSHLRPRPNVDGVAMDILQRHRTALFNKFSQEFAALERELKEELAKG